GTVRQILPTPEVIINVILYDVLIDVANPDHLLMTQMSAQVFFVLAQVKDALLVPVAALEAVPPRSGDSGPGKNFRVRVVGPTGPVTREIRIGLRNRTMAEVLAGLSEGEPVLLPVTDTASTNRSRTAAPLPRLA